jgi:hypothetical protein
MAVKEILFPAPASDDVIVSTGVPQVGKYLECIPKLLASIFTDVE